MGSWTRTQPRADAASSMPGPSGYMRCVLKRRRGKDWGFVDSEKGADHPAEGGRGGRAWESVSGGFRVWTAERTGRPQAAWYVVAPCCRKESTYVAIFDTHGVPVWWFNTHRPPLDASLLPDGDVAWAQQHGKDLAPGISAGTYEEHTLNGKLRRTFSIPGGTPTDRHELQLLPNGDYLVVAYKPRDAVDLSPYGGPSNATVLDAVIDEITPDRKIAWSWRSSDHIDLAESSRWYQPQVLPKPARLNDGRT